MAEARTLAAKIEKLFQTIKRPDGSEHSVQEVARWCANHTGESFSKQYLWYLRRGDRDNPTKRHLEALARFFDVDESYFFDAERSRKIQANLDLAVAIREGRVNTALRAVNLSDEDYAKVTQVLEEFRKRGDTT